MKGVVFLIIASLLVLGLALPGCGGGPSEEENFIDIAVAGPMTFDQGLHIWYGAEMATEEINSAGGVDIGGVMHRIRLTKVDTNEIMDVTGTDGVMALSGVIDDVDFVMGGFQETATEAYRQVAMDKGKIFINVGVSTEPLHYSVVTDYDRYKYFFQGAVINDYFLDLMFSQTFTLVLAYAMGTAESLGAANFTPRVAIVAEDEEWSKVGVAAMEAFLQGQGWYVGTWLADANAGAEEVQTVLTEINVSNPHFIYTIMSGPVGVSFSKFVHEAVPGAMVVGCNTEAQRKEYADLTTYDPNKAPGCSYEIFADYLAPGVQITNKTTAFFNAFVDKYDEYPMYTAGCYDALYSLMQNAKAAAAALDVNDIADVVSPENIDVLIATMEGNTYQGAAGRAGYFPLPIELEAPVTHPYYGITTKYVLSEEVVDELYPHLATYGMTYDPAWWTVPPHTAHCIIGGVGWSTGISSQWQEVSPGVWDKRAVWPAVLFDPGDIAGMIENGWLNQWGNYNFAYTGSSELQIPDWWIAYHFAEYLGG